MSTKVSLPSGKHLGSHDMVVHDSTIVEAVLVAIQEVPEIVKGVKVSMFGMRIELKYGHGWGRMQVKVWNVDAYARQTLIYDHIAHAVGHVVIDAGPLLNSENRRVEDFNERVIRDRLNSRIGQIRMIFHVYEN